LQAAPSVPPMPTEITTPPKRKRRKVRTAWISFVGRITAQIVGAVASVVLGLIFLDKYNSHAAKAAADAPAPARSSYLASHRVEMPSGELALAVLPLQNYSADAGQAYVADGITEALITDLAQIKGLRVTSRTSSMAYRGVARPLPDIAHELSVDLMLEGSVVCEGGRARITAQLIDADTDQHVWARSYDRPVRDLLALQAAVAGIIAKEVGVAVGPRLEQRMARRFGPF
jgi:TolB-like protein